MGDERGVPDEPAGGGGDLLSQQVVDDAATRPPRDGRVGQRGTQRRRGVDELLDGEEVVASCSASSSPTVAKTADE